MPLPVWIVAIRDPAHAYMLLSAGNTRPRPRFRRRRNAELGYALAGPGAGVPILTDEEMQRLHAEGAAAGRAFIERVRDVERRHSEVLRASAADLTQVGATRLRTTAGDIHARVIRFRNQAVVLEIVYPGGWSQSRSTQSTLADACVHGLANALAQAGPAAEPS